MSQEDYNAANASGAAFRADINNIFGAIATNNSGTSAPATTFAHMWWFDTTNNLLKQRNAGDDAWVTVASKVDETWVPYSEGNALTVGEEVGDIIRLEDLGDTAGTPTLPAVDGSQLTGIGSVVQQAYLQTGTGAVGSTVIPFDDTIPQSGEGVEFMTLAITPRSATNVLLIEAIAHVSHAADNHVTAALFQDSTANALAVMSARNPGPSYHQALTIRHRMLAGTTSATTFKVRCGGGAAGNVRFNGTVSNGDAFGGTLASGIRITEIAP